VFSGCWTFAGTHGGPELNYQEGEGDHSATFSGLALKEDCLFSPLFSCRRSLLLLSLVTCTYCPCRSLPLLSRTSLATVPIARYPHSLSSLSFLIAGGIPVRRFTPPTYTIWEGYPFLPICSMSRLIITQSQSDLT
jgi:hypothetical protein